jgi:hypothetical protein
MTEISENVEWFISAIISLPGDSPVPIGTPGYNTYTSQKAHWLGWLNPNSGTGTYVRASNPNRDARDIYNRIVEPKMLLWLAEAAGVCPSLVNSAKEDASQKMKLASKSAAIRKHIPWQVIVDVLNLRSRNVGN